MFRGQTILLILVQRGTRLREQLREIHITINLLFLGRYSVHDFYPVLSIDDRKFILSLKGTYPGRT